jgi:hypothetical protein
LQEEERQNQEEEDVCRKIVFFQEETQKNQWQEAEHKFAKGGYSTVVVLYLYATDSELVSW